MSGVGFQSCSTGTWSIPIAQKGVPTLHVTVNLGWTFDEHYGAQAGEANINDILGPVFVRFVASCLSFMEQRITIPVSRPASRATRRRMERNHATFQAAAEVQVIELRRRERRHQEQADEGDREPPEWHVQWLVAGPLAAALFSSRSGAQAALHRAVRERTAGQTAETASKPAVRGQALMPHEWIRPEPWWLPHKDSDRSG